MGSRYRLGRFANVRKFDRPGVTQPEIEHAVRHTRERRLFGVSPLVEQFNRIALRSSADNREITIGPPAEENRHELRLSIEVVEK